MKLLIPVLLAPVVMSLSSTQVIAAIQTRNIEYKHGDTVLEGYLAYDDSITGKLPGVLVVHEWNGLQSFVKERTEELAKLGYVAFAADIYGKGIRPNNPEESGKQASIYRQDRQLLRDGQSPTSGDRTLAGLKVLQQNPLTDIQRIAAIGYCFGGGTVLELARSGVNIAGLASFHGNLDTPKPNDAKNIQAKVLVLHGADDPIVPEEQVQAFATEMREANVDWQLISYGGAVHSFTNPVVEKRSWQALKQFFAEIFPTRKS
ncbi:dienelactone hydrolase family protein [Nodularia spumigena CS-586/05]|uniref:dienelactone hydrolase family protein n=1 Tax=Nodularia spumigena TaxID=70799 RepID=UPI00232EB6EB|nr:dienelactone hydrolase family protein [Nodularia spumigena]MDB9344029.1 dienelactone hydrolase family protein [Nodularia spumigena CS-588/06]MDB9370852.1 dienelactone hydrolase family protein [Nodularia spumigena CS-586/05]